MDAGTEVKDHVADIREVKSLKSEWLRMWVFEGEVQREETRKGGREGERRKKQRGQNPFKDDTTLRCILHTDFTNTQSFFFITGFRSIWISLPQELGQVCDALWRCLLPPLLQLQKGVCAMHSQGNGDPREDALRVDALLPCLQGRDPGSRSSLLACSLREDDFGHHCYGGRGPCPSQPCQERSRSRYCSIYHHRQLSVKLKSWQG